MRDHERTDVSVRAITIFFVSLLAAGAAILLLMWGLFVVLKAERKKAEEPPSPMLKEQPVPPGPPLPIQDIKELRAEQDKLLANYGWLDRPAGVVHIPAERAMELLIERGLLKNR